MDPLTLGLIAAGLIGAGSGFIQQNWSQGFQSDEAEKGRDFSAQQATLNRQFSAQQSSIARDWSERMASTAVQRQVADMKSAGINPALMAGGAGAAATPGGIALGAGGGTPSPTAFGTAVPNAGAAISNVMSSAVLATLKSNAHDFAERLETTISQQQRQAENAYQADMKHKAILKNEMEKKAMWESVGKTYNSPYLK